MISARKFSALNANFLKAHLVLLVSYLNYQITEFEDKYGPSYFIAASCKGKINASCLRVFMRQLVGKTL